MPHILPKTSNALLVAGLVCWIALTSSLDIKADQMTYQTCTFYASHATQSLTCSTGDNTGGGSGSRYGQRSLVECSYPWQSVNQTASITMQSLNAWQMSVLKTPSDHNANHHNISRRHVEQSCVLRKTMSDFGHTSPRQSRKATRQVVA